MLCRLANNCMEDCIMLLNIRAFALTFAFWWGVGVFTVTWWVMIRDVDHSGMEFLLTLYPGYSVSVWGSLIGFVWGFVDGLIGGAIFAWLYNFIAIKLPMKM